MQVNTKKLGVEGFYCNFFFYISVLIQLALTQLITLSAKINIVK